MGVWHLISLATAPINGLVCPMKELQQTEDQIIHLACLISGNIIMYVEKIDDHLIR
jgi:hypothetical protein